MRLYTLSVDDKEIVAAEGRNGELFALDALGIKVKDMNELIDRWEDGVRLSIVNGLEKADSFMAVKNYKILAPIPNPKQDMICLGVNYRSHMDETKDVLDFTKKADTIYFSKRVNRANDPDGHIPYYKFVDSLDYEAELGVVIGQDTYAVKKEDAENYIFGYTVINDVSARNIQHKHQQWYLGKSLDGYTPMGPCIVTADEIKDPHDLGIRCFVNNEERQSSNTGFMITSPEEAIEELSEGMTLLKGTVIATGTPGGVGMGMKPPVFLKPGDVVRCEIEGIGAIENTVG